jgi:hypothetical protein
VRDDLTDSRHAARRNLVSYGLVALIPLAVIVALLVLAAMATNSAAATGGCGGG